MAEIAPLDLVILQQRRVRARILSLTFFGFMLTGAIFWPFWREYTSIDLPVLWLTWASFPVSVFLFATALRYRKLLIFLRGRGELLTSPDTLRAALEASKKRLVIWVLLVLSPIFGVLIVSLAVGGGFGLILVVAMIVPILTVSGLFGSAFEFNNFRALSTMIAWSQESSASQAQRAAISHTDDI
jgi:hypothetical protein